MGSDVEDAPPLVSVVVPLYNGQASIEETLTSIQRQQLASLEVIVVDDGSSDQGTDLVRRHPIGATLVEQSHLGVAVARNRGLALARGRWIAFLDQDDLWHPSHIERVLRWLHANPEERIVFVRETAFAVADEAEQLRADDSASLWATVLVDGEDTYDELVASADVAGSDEIEVHDVRAVLGGPISMTTSFVADPELLRIVGGFAPHALAMDDYWMLVNVARIQPIPQLDQPTVFYRVHARATSRTAKLGLPFLSSAIALRLGGGIVPFDEGLRGGTDGKLHRHLFLELLRAPDFADPRFRRAVGHIAALLWPPKGRRPDLWRALVALRAPWIQSAARSVRASVRHRAGR